MFEFGFSDSRRFSDTKVIRRCGHRGTFLNFISTDSTYSIGFNSTYTYPGFSLPTPLKGLSHEIDVGFRCRGWVQVRCRSISSNSLAGPVVQLFTTCHKGLQFAPAVCTVQKPVLFSLFVLSRFNGIPDVIVKCK
jgi:hypothetical protein